MLDIHVGVRRDALRPFKRILDETFEKRNILSTMEDRWEAWATHWSDEQAEDEDIIHVIVSSEVPMSTLQFLVSNMLVFLNEITDEDNPFVGRYILVTDHDKWTNFYHELMYPEFA